jgi:hypothetical protein
MLRVGIRLEGEEGRMCGEEGRSLEGMKEGLWGEEDCKGRRKVVRSRKVLKVGTKVVQRKKGNEDKGKSCGGRRFKVVRAREVVSEPIWVCDLGTGPKKTFFFIFWPLISNVFLFLPVHK